MDWASALFGFALGLIGSLATIWVERVLQRRDETTYSAKVVEGLIAEIEVAVDRAEEMARLADQGAMSYSRLYVALWESTRARLAATLADADTLILLHRIYHAFDLVNFNCEKDRGASGAFAKLYLPDVKKDLIELKRRV